MPKVSLYELEHEEDEVTFEKVRSKKSKQPKEAKYPEKIRRREKKIDYYEALDSDVTERE